VDTSPALFDAAIVDLDGTLVDTLGDFEVALNAMLRELALPPVAAADIARMVGRGSEHLIRSVLASAGGPLTLFDAAFDAYQRHYLAVNGRHSRVYAGAAEGLAALRGMGLKLACLTNKPASFTHPLLATKDLAKYFDAVFGGDAFERKKPDPLPLVRTCEALGTSTQRTLMIGDSSNDARAARAAGCAVVLVTYGYNHGEPVRAVDADGFVDAIADVPAWIRQRACRAARP
jgi:phosphoglycolate phosphatase